MDSHTIGALLTFAGITAAILTVGMCIEHTAQPERSAIADLAARPRGLVISILLTLPVLYVAGWVHYGHVQAAENQDRPPTVEQRQARVDQCVQHYTPDCGPAGPPSTMTDPGQPGQFGDRLKYDAWRQDTIDKFGDDEEPFAKPRVR